MDRGENSTLNDPEESNGFDRASHDISRRRKEVGIGPGTGESTSAPGPCQYSHVCAGRLVLDRQLHALIIERHPHVAEEREPQDPLDVDPPRLARRPVEEDRPQVVAGMTPGRR